MGWGTGSQIMSEIIDETKSAIPNEKKRTAFYIHLIHIFEEHDCDTLDDCVLKDEAFDQALIAMHYDIH